MVLMLLTPWRYPGARQTTRRHRSEDSYSTGSRRESYSGLTVGNRPPKLRSTRVLIHVNLNKIDWQPDVELIQVSSNEGGAFGAASDLPKSIPIPRSHVRLALNRFDTRTTFSDISASSAAQNIAIGDNGGPLARYPKYSW
jgi:hypothetical protein